MGGYVIQSRHGTKGNFEVVAPPSHGGGLAHLWRNNDAGSMPWSGPTCFGGGSRYVGSSLIQGNYGSPGNLEVVAVDEAGNLDFFWRMDRSPWTWSGPFRITTALRGTPSLIQSRHGTKGNFEVVTPHRDGGLAHLWRNNDAASMPWSAPFRFGGTARYTGATVIQGNYGSPGNLEVVAVDEAGNLDFFWRMDRSPWTWSGPFRIGTEISFAVSECVYAWTARYLQADTHVAVRIQLNPDAGIPAATIAALQTTWRNGIIGKWSNRFDCRAPGGQRKTMTFDVQWVTSNAHHVVRVQTGPARSNMTTWDTLDTGDVASHEFGHMLGHPDEYADSACPARNPVNTGTVMDNNTQTVARHYNRITQFHCGHTPTAVGAPEPGAQAPGEEARMTLRSIDRLEPARRADVLQRLRAMADADRTPSGAGDAEVSFEVSGGAPGERYAYRLAVRADGAAERETVDELRGQAPSRDSGTVDRALAARVFAAAGAGGLLDDTAPGLTGAAPAEGREIVPDSLIATITVRDGNDVRRLSVPATEPDTEPAGALAPGEATDIPVQTHVQLPRVAVEALAPVLSALQDVEAAM